MTESPSHVPSPSPSERIAVLAGGVGAARLLRGLVAAVDPERVTAIVNTGDDVVMHGLHVSPDLDTVTYTLAGAIDPERGWGLVDESWRAIESLHRYADVRPGGSSAATTWFNLGDRDLATHMYRTARLREGATLGAVTDEIRRAWDVQVEIVPMSDDRLSTLVTLAEGAPTVDGDSASVGPSEVSFQDYFVRLRHSVPVSAVRFVGDARLASRAAEVLDGAGSVVIAPSNPLVSIGPLRALPGLDERLTERRDSVVAVSPIVGGAALKGPADRMMTELGHRSDVVGVARLYAPIAATLVIDEVDGDLRDDVEAEGMRCVVTDTIMSDPAVAARLAETTLDATR